VTNWMFVIIFACEAVMKIIGLGRRQYFANG